MLKDSGHGFRDGPRMTPALRRWKKPSGPRCRAKVARGAAATEVAMTKNSIDPLANWPWVRITALTIGVELTSNSNG